MRTMRAIRLHKIRTELLPSDFGAARKQWPVTSVHVELLFNPAGRLATGNHLTRRIELQGDLSDDQRARFLQIANVCPIHKVLSGEVRNDTSLAG